MTQDEQQRSEVVNYWWDKAESSILSAQRELDAGAYIYSINRLYYALFYAVSAVLLEKDITFKKHSGVRAAFHRNIVKPGLMEIKWGKLYDQLFEDRHEGDYIALIEFNKSYVETRLKECKAFLTELKKVT